jgi:hypothetical protein
MCVCVCMCGCVCTVSGVRLCVCEFVSMSECVWGGGVRVCACVSMQVCVHMYACVHSGYIKDV